MDPLFSIIVPVYNAEKYLHQCIQSILQQTFSEFELILINDGSKDNSLSICQEYEKKDLRIKVINQNNAGVSNTRNIGIEKAKGKYILFIDSDDFIVKDYLSNFRQMSAEFDYDLLVCGLSKFYGENDSRNTIYNYKDSHALGKKEVASLIPLLDENSLFGGPVVKCYKRSILIKHKIVFDPSFNFGEDQIFNLLYLQFVESIAVSSIIGYYYVQRQTESLSKKKYSFDQENKFANEVTRLREQLIKELNIQSKVFASMIIRERSLHKINAILSMYMPQYIEIRKRRIQLIKQELVNINTKSLPSYGAYYKILRFIFKLPHPFLIDVCLRGLTFILNK